MSYAHYFTRPTVIRPHQPWVPDLSSPDNAPDSKKLGGTGFPACAKNTRLFRVIESAVIGKQVIS